MAEIDGDENNNTLTGTTGSDTIHGNGGNDSLHGNDGNDTIYGGDGDDTLDGGRGDDLIIGGRGDDTMTAGQNSPCDTFLIRDGDGNDTITDFDTGEPDVIAFNMAEIQSISDVYDRMSMDGNDTVITYDTGETTRLTNVDMANFGPSNFQMQSGPVCFLEGTFIATVTGFRRIETLRPGDLIFTRDDGPQPLLQLLRQTVRFKTREDRARPILIKRGAFGPQTPFVDLIVSPQHRILVTVPATQEEVLVPAVKLLSRNGVRRMRGRSGAVYLNLLLPRHAIVLANDIAAESLLVTPYTRAPVHPHLLTPALEDAHATPARRLVLVDPAKGATGQGTGSAPAIVE